MTVYTKIQFPQASASGFTYQANNPNQNLTNYAAYIPSTATLSGSITPPSWDPYSTNPADRVMYVADANGTLTYAQVMDAAYGVPALQTMQIAKLYNQLNQNMNAGVSITVNGVSYQISVSGNALASNLAKVMSANMILTQVKPWVAGTDYPPASMVSVNGVVLFTSTGGTSGSTTPTAPSSFDTPVVDNTVSWALMGMLIRLVNNGIAWFTPQDIISSFTQSMLSVTDAESELLNMVTQIQAAADYSTISTINMPSTASTSNTASASAA